VPATRSRQHPGDTGALPDGRRKARIFGERLSARVSFGAIPPGGGTLVTAQERSGLSVHFYRELLRSEGISRSRRSLVAAASRWAAVRDRTPCRRLTSPSDENQIRSPQQHVTGSRHLWAVARTNSHHICCSVAGSGGVSLPAANPTSWIASVSPGRSSLPSPRLNGTSKE